MTSTTAVFAPVPVRALRRLASVPAVITLLLAGCHACETAAPEVDVDDQVLATVNDRSITVERFRRSYASSLVRTGGADTRSNREAHLGTLVQSYLLAEEARRRGFDGEPGFRDHADRQLRLALGARFLDMQMDTLLSSLTEAEAREAFRESKERVALRHLVFRDPARAAAAWRRLEQGEDFVELANETYRTAAFDSAAGFLGFVRYSDLDDAIAEAAAGLDVGSYSEPLRSRYGWHVLRVEERLTEPLITESEYQYRRHGVVGRAAVRRNRLARDRFVRSLMESLDVRVDPVASRQVVETVQEILVGAGQDGGPRPVLDPAEIEAIRASLEPGTILLTYARRGREYSFTAADYERWLPELPYDEVRHRTVASIGRALRNDVLAMEGLEIGLDGDPYVHETVGFAEAAYLADRMREFLAEHPPIQPTEAELAEAYDRLGYRTLEEVRADYWQVAFSSLQAADSALSDIRSGRREAEDYESFARFEDVDVLRSDLGKYIRRAPIGRTVVLCENEDACHVLHVVDRRVRYAEYGTRKDAVRDRLSAVLTVAHATDSLYRNAEVDVDSALFSHLMNPED